jgi:hypothetical protein
MSSGKRPRRDAGKEGAQIGAVSCPERSFVDMQLQTVRPECDEPPRPDDDAEIRLGRGLKHPKNNGYAKLFVSVGYDPNWAGFQAAYVVEQGRIRAATSQKRAAFAKALRQLAKPDLSDEAFRENAKIVDEAMNGTLLLDDSFNDFSLFEDLTFIREIRFCVSGDMAGRAEISRIADAMSRRVAVSRGRKLTVASAAHEYLLETLSIFGDQAYTWSPEEEGFTDRYTQATREEFDDPTFSPLAAARRVRKTRGSRRD